MNAVTWYMIFIGFLGNDINPSYSLILDDVPMLTQTSCAKRAEPTNATYIQSQLREYPDLEGFWVCAADKVGLSRTETNTGWHIVWTGYEGDNSWATVALIAPKRYMAEQDCYRALASAPSPKNKKLTWENLCAEPITGTTFP